MHNMCSHTEGSKNLDLTHTLEKRVVSWVPLWALPAMCYLLALPAHASMIFCCVFFLCYPLGSTSWIKNTLHITNFLILIVNIADCTIGYLPKAYNIMYFNVSIGLPVMAYLSVSICVKLCSIIAYLDACRIKNSVFFCRSLKLSVDINYAHVLVRDWLYRHHDIQKTLLYNI